MISCFNQAFGYVLEQYGYSSKKLFSLCWGINYDMGILKNDRRLQIHYSESIEKCFFESYGIECVKIQGEPSFGKVIQDALDKEKWVIVNTDAYSCPWSPSYQSFHINHYFNLLRCNGNLYTIIDRFHTKEEFVKEVDLINNLVNQIYVVGNKCGDEKFNSNKIMENIDRSYKSEKQLIQIYDRFKVGIGELLQNHNFIKLSPDHSQTIVTMKFIATNRYGLNELIKNLNIEKAEEIAQLLRTSTNKWDTLRMILIKYILNRNVTEKTTRQVCEILNEILNIEMEIYLKNKTVIGGI